MPVVVHYVILNGPARACKVLGREVTTQLNAAYLGGHKSHAKTDALHAPIKNFIASALGEKFGEMNVEKMRPELNGYSVNDTMQEVIRCMKAFCEDDIYSRLLTHRTLRDVPLPNFVVVEDVTHIDEIIAFDLKTIIHVADAAAVPAVMFDYIGTPHLIAAHDGSRDSVRDIARNVVNYLLEGRSQ